MANDGTPEPLDDVLGALRERAKELSCLYRIDGILSSEAPPDEVFRRVVEALPTGWQYPEITQPRLEIRGQVYRAQRAQETPWVQKARIRAGREPVGELAIYYTEERPEADVGPFLKEERQLLNALAERIGDYVLRTEGSKPEPAREPGDGAWRVILDFLGRTDPRLLQWITRKMLNHLRWRGVTEAEELVPVSARKPEVAPGDENRPLTRVSTSALRPGTDDVFRIAADHLSDQEILSHVQMWISQDKVSFLVHALEDPSTSLPEITEALERFEAIGVSEEELPHSLQTMLRVALLRRFFTDQIGFINTAKSVVSVADFYDLSRHLLAPRGSHGRLGGKSAGMFLAWQVVKNSPEYGDVLKDIRVPRTWYIASDAVLAFVRYNNLDEIYDQKYLEIEQVRQQYPHVVQVFKSAEFPPELEKGLAAVLDDLGDVPLIVRSSSLLEDRTGSAFSGKYKSLFLANQGSKKERLQALMDAVAEVYASIFGPDPIEYRAERHLLDVHEEMGIMIQEVVGQRVGKYWMPAFSGVALSTNEFRWSPRIRREDGLLRLVPGLGTRAVDRLSDDYPVLLAPGQPGLRVNTTTEERLRYTPRSVDVINLETNAFETVPAADLIREFGHRLPAINRMVSIVEDGHIRQPRGLTVDWENADAIITFEGLAADSPFISQAATFLDILEAKLGMPVDVEFASDGRHAYILQCRAQSYGPAVAPARIPRDLPSDRIVFSANRHISNGTVPELSHIVYVVPDRYTELPERQDLMDVARAVGRLNNVLPRRRFMLIGPGRWGSRGDIHLGVPVSYADINNTALLSEVARQKGSYVPDLSFGTHFFQDLVEAEIRYLPLYPDDAGTVFDEAFLLDAPNKLAELAPSFARLADTVRVIHVPDVADGRILRVLMNGEEDRAVGYLNRPSPVR
ncbi:MAG: PEP/pyruvate-binding domain-containing protein [Candidatus Longimicrobiales bacterium M2_2A_002]